MAALFFVVAGGVVVPDGEVVPVEGGVVPPDGTVLPEGEVATGVVPPGTT